MIIIASIICIGVLLYYIYRLTKQLKVMKNKLNQTVFLHSDYLPNHTGRLIFARCFNYSKSVNTKFYYIIGVVTVDDNGTYIVRSFKDIISVQKNILDFVVLE